MYLFSILIFQLLWCLGLMGHGTLVARLICDSGTPCFSKSRHAMIGGILGFALVTLAGTVLNFVTPLNGMVSSLLFCSGLMLFMLNLRGFVASMARSDWLVLLGLLLLVWAMSLLGINEPDTKTYHLQTVRWVKEAVPPFGLANLHGRLGYNSLWFVAAAAMELPLGPKSAFLANAVMMYFYGGFAVLTLKEKLSVPLSISETFLALSLVPWGWVACFGKVASLSNDVPVMLITFLMCYFILYHLEHGIWDRFIPNVLLLLSFFAVTIKLSAAILPLTYLAYLVWKKWGEQGAETVLPPGGDGLRPKSYMVPVLVAILTVSWAMRSVILSGCVIFPIADTCFGSLKWAVPGAFVQYEADFIKGFARASDLLTPETTNQVLGNWNWMTVWIEKWFLGRDLFYILPLLLMFLTGCIRFYSVLSEKKLLYDHRSRACALVLGATSLGGLFWFFSAPDFRFGLGYLYAFCMTMNCYPINQSVGDKIVRTRNRRAVVIGGIILAVFTVKAGRFLLSGQQFAHIPETSMSRTEVIDGIGVTFADKGDCADASLPCTSFLDKGLRIQAGRDGKPVMFWFEKKGGGSR